MTAPPLRGPSALAALALWLLTPVGWGPLPLLPRGWSAEEAWERPWAALRALATSAPWDAEDEYPAHVLAGDEGFCAPRRRTVVRVDSGHVVAFLAGVLVWPAADVLRLLRIWWLRQVRRVELLLGIGRPATP